MISPGDVPVLDLTLVERLAETWAEHEAPIVQHLAPGLSDAEMDEITAPLGLSLPSEARVWWGWHDGVPFPEKKWAPERALGPGIEYKPLRDAVTDYVLDRKIFTDVEGDPEPFRPAAYFPITRASGPILCDCSVPDGAPSPIYYAHEFDSQPEHMQRPAARSFGEMVTWWIEAIHDGAWRWNSDSETWTAHPEGLDPVRARSGLV